MKPFFKNLFFIVVIAISFTATYFALTNHMRVVHILSNSMAPDIKRGDLLVIRSIPTAKLQVGQIAILPALKEPGVYFSHRIIEIKREQSGRIVVKTKGDANPIADDDAVAVTSKMIPISIFSLPTSDLNNLRAIPAITTLASSSLLILALYAFVRPKRKVLE